MVLLEDTIINSLKRIVVQGGNLFSTTPSFILTPICKKKFWKNFWEIRDYVYICIMEKSIIIGYEVREDGRMYLDLKTKNNDPTKHSEFLSVIVGALGMTIRMAGEHGHKTEGEVFRDVINHLTNEFVNSDSFKDLEIKR